MAQCPETRKDGQPCGAPATRSGKCAGHSHFGISADPVANQARSAEAKRAKAEARKLSAIDLLHREVERNAAALVAGVLQASETDWRATQWLYERVYGKPTERVETVSSELDPEQMTEQQRAELRRRLVQEHPELAELVPRKTA